MKSIAIIVSFTLFSCDGQTPEEVTAEFEAALASGDCEKAKSMTIEEAQDFIQQMIDLGCPEASENKLKTVKCQKENEITTCKCFHGEQGYEGAWTYRLKKIDGIWKIFRIDEFAIDEINK